MSDNEIEDVSFLPGPGQGGTGKRAVYEPSGTQRCKQIICSKNYAILIVSIFVCLVLAVALIASFARPGKQQCSQGGTSVPEVTASAEVPSTTGEPFPWHDIRLPDSIIPVSYTIDMHPNLTSFIFNGNVSITIEVKKATDFIVFHSKNLNITSYTMKQELEDMEIEYLHIKRHLENEKFEQVYVEMERALVAGQKYTLMLKFTGVLSELLTGFYRSSYKNAQGETRWLATTHFEPTDARAAFPCFDEPAMKAYFQMRIVREPGYISLFNMPREDTLPYDDGLEVDYYKQSVLMSTYLVAFIVCDYAVLSQNTSRGTVVSVYAPPDQIKQGQFALSAAVTCLEFYEEFFSINYPLLKQDLIAIPDFAAGAMENWGLITYRMTTILYDPKESSASNMQKVAVVVAHELAHQWFGNLVTMKWWNDLWLNEGFATFVEYIGANRVKPEWKMLDQFIVENLQGALSEDSLGSSHPISVPVQDPAQINEIFDAISYDKGASVIRMLQGFVGPDVIQKGLTHYLKKFKFGNAATDDLWEALSAETDNIDVKQVMDTWTLQMGYPLVTLTNKGDQILAEQERFLLNPNNQVEVEFTSPYGYKWQIPLTFLTDKGPDTSSHIYWMNMTSNVFQPPKGFKWIKANVNQTGFYRVHYSDTNWIALKNQLLDDHKVFTAADRAGLLDDVFALARAGKLKAKLALELSTYLVKEKEYVPWYVGMVNLAYIGSVLEEKDTYTYYAKYVKYLMENLISKMDWDDSVSHLQKFLRGLLLGMAVKLNHEKVVKDARTYFTNWKENGARVPPDLKSIVYHAGVQYGGDADWEYCWKQYQATQIPSEKQKLLVAMAVTSDVSRLNRFLHMSLQDNKVRKQDTGIVVGQIGASSAAGRILAWRFFKSNFETFSKRYGHGSFEMTRLVQRVAGDFTTQYDYDEVAEFFKMHNAGSGQRAVSQALESIRMNIDWLDRNEDEVLKWLQDFTNAVEMS